MDENKEYTIKIPHFYCMEYYEDNKRIVIDIDMRDTVLYLHPGLIEHWESPYEKVEIEFHDKIRILHNIRDYLLSEGISPEEISMKDC